MNGNLINNIFKLKNKEYQEIIDYCLFFNNEYNDFLNKKYTEIQIFIIKSYYYFNKINSEIKYQICNNYSTFGRSYTNGFNKTCSTKIKNITTNITNINNNTYFYFNYYELKDYINTYIKKKSKFIFLNNYKNSDIFLNSIKQLFDTNIYSINEIIYLIYNNNEYSIKQSICQCGNKNKFINHNIGFNKFCSNQCGTKYSINKIKQTKLEKYGNENYNNSIKRKKTNLEKYGVYHFNKQQHIKEN